MENQELFIRDGFAETLEYIAHLSRSGEVNIEKLNIEDIPVIMRVGGRKKGDSIMRVTLECRFVDSVKEG